MTAEATAVMQAPAHTAPAQDHQPLVRAEGLAKTFDVSPPWLNRVLER